MQYRILMFMSRVLCHLPYAWLMKMGDCLGILYYKLIKKQRNLAVFGEYLWWEGPTAHSSSDAVYAFEKLVFGTDEPPDQLDNMLGRYEAMLDANNVPEASRRKIYGETMARILGIEVRP